MRVKETRPRRGLADLTREECNIVVEAYKRLGGYRRVGLEMALSLNTVRAVVVQGIGDERHKYTQKNSKKYTQKNSKKPGVFPKLDLIAKPPEDRCPYKKSEYYLIQRRRMDGLPPRLVMRYGLEYLDGVILRDIHQRMKSVNEECVRVGDKQVDTIRDWIVPA